eukprot:gene25811-34398_t
MHGGFVISIFLSQLLFAQSLNLLTPILTDIQRVLEYISVTPRVIPSNIIDQFSDIASTSSTLSDVSDLYWLSLEKVIVDNVDFASRLRTLSDEFLGSVESVVKTLNRGNNFEGSFNMDEIKLELADVATQNIHLLEETKEFYEKSILNNGLSTIDFLSRSPIAKDTVIAIEKVEQLLRSNIFEQNKAILAENIGKILQDVSSKSLDSAGANILVEFNKILDTNPKLRLSSSEYVVDAYNSEVLPRAIDTAAFLARSPLAQNTKAVALAPTSQIVADFLTRIAERAAPLGDSIDGIVTFQQQRITDALSAVSASTVKSLADITIPNDLDIDISVQWQPSLPLSPQLMADSVDGFGTLAVQVAKTADELLPSLERGGVTLSLELGKAGSALLSNSVSAAGSVSQALLQLGQDSVTVFPKRTAELVLQDVLPTASKTVAGTIAQAQTLEQQLLVGLRDAEAQTEELLNAATRWQLFSDPNHLENGFWERQLANANAFLRNWNDDSLPAIEKTAEDTYVAAVDRFAEIAQRNNRLVELTESSQRLLSAIRTLSDEVKEKVESGSEDSSTRLTQLAHEFQLQTSATLTLVSKLQSEVSRSLGNLESQVLVDLPHYVEDFIVKGQDL